jgi:hypothetical protein
VSGDKPIRFSRHASDYRVRRGFSEAEVVLVIREGRWELARGNRLEAVWDFSFEGEWNGRQYDTKRVRVIFVDEDEEIVVVTVYTYFF